MISVITCTNRSEMMENIFQNYARQTITEKELIIVLNQDQMNITDWQTAAQHYPAVTIYQLPERMTVSDCKNFAIEKATYNHIAKFDDDDYYAPAYLQSALAVFKKYKQADIVGKTSVYFYFEERRLLCLLPSQTVHTWVNHVVDSTLVFKKDILKSVRFKRQKVGSDKQFQKDCKAMGYNIFTTDCDNHAVIRRKNQQHTWKIRDQQLIDACQQIIYTDDFQAIVTVH